MQIIALDIGDDCVNLVECLADSNGLHPRIVRTKSFTFDGRVSAPRKHLARQLVRLIQHLASNATTLLVNLSPTQSLLHKRVLERIKGHCVWGHLRALEGDSATQLVKAHLREIRNWKGI